MVRRLSPPASSDLQALLQVPYDTPDSPLTATESVDDWALSSLAGGISDDDAALVNNSFVMPSNMQIVSTDDRLLSATPREVGKLRTVIMGAPRTGKSALVKALEQVPPLHSAQQIYLSAGLTTISFKAFCTDHTISFVDGAHLEYLEDKLHETAGLINGIHPSAIPILTQARSLDAFPLCDCVIYCFASSPTTTDLTQLKEISRFAPVLPLVTMCDLLSSVELFARRVEIKRSLENNQIPIHYFDGQSLPFAVSTNTTRNWNMSASQVESSGYKSQTLVESQLPLMVEHLLAGSRTIRENAAHLFAEHVARTTMRSALENFPQPKYYHLNLPNALVSQLGAAGTDCSAGAISESVGSQQSRDRKMGPIGNIDPLDIGKWVQTVGYFSAFALTLAGAGVALSPATVTTATIWQNIITPALLCPF